MGGKDCRVDLLIIDLIEELPDQQYERVSVAGSNALVHISSKRSGVLLRWSGEGGGKT